MAGTSRAARSPSQKADLLSGRPQSIATRSVRNGQDHDGYVARALVALDALQEFRPRHLGQVEAEQDQLRPHRLPLGIAAGAEQVVQPGLSVADDPERIRELRPFERERRLRCRRIVLHQQNILHFSWRRCRADARCGSRPRGGRREQIPHGDLQRLCQMHDGPQRHVARPALDVRDVGAVHVGPPRQFLLRDAQPVPTRPNDGAEPSLEV
jgi:hypothetical protein